MSQPATTPSAPLVYVSLRRATALDPSTGRPLWGYEADKDIARMIFSEDRIFFLDAAGNIHCVVAATGQLLGKVKAATKGIGGAMVSAGGVLYVATTGGVTCVSRDGQILWAHEAPGGQFSVLPGLGLPGQVVQPDFNT